jgi:hypothetical protein
MDASLSALFARLDSGRSRRAFLALSGVAAGAVASRVPVLNTAARKKRKKKRKKNGAAASGPPLLALAYACPGPPEAIGSYLLITRVAQVFVAQRSGTLRRIEFLVDKPAGSMGDYVVQLLRVESGTPVHGATQILAGITISNAAVPDGESTLTATFAGPVLEAGAEYAATIGRVAAGVRLGFFSGTGNGCAGQVFTSTGGAFAAAPSQDVVVSVFVE